MHQAGSNVVLMFGFLLAGAVAVHPDYVFNRLVGPLPSTVPKDSSEGAELAAVMTSRQCCKLGERAGYRGLPCNLELHLTSRTDNMVFKQKLKHLEYQEFESWKRTASPAVDAAKCSGFKKLFEKCCNHRVRKFRRSSLESDV